MKGHIRYRRCPFCVLLSQEPRLIKCDETGFLIKSFLKGIKDSSRLTFKHNNAAMVRETILPSCLKSGNECNISDRFPPCRTTATYPVTYNDKIVLENNDGFLWPPTVWIVKDKCPLKTVQFVLR